MCETDEDHREDVIIADIPIDRERDELEHTSPYWIILTILSATFFVFLYRRFLM